MKIWKERSESTEFSLRKISSRNELSVDTLMEELRLILLENYEFENRGL